MRNQGVFRRVFHFCQTLRGKKTNSPSPLEEKLSPSNRSNFCPNFPPLFAQLLPYAYHFENVKKKEQAEEQPYRIMRWELARNVPLSPFFASQSFFGVLTSPAESLALAISVEMSIASGKGSKKKTITTAGLARSRHLRQRVQHINARFIGLLFPLSGTEGPKREEVY